MKVIKNLFHRVKAFFSTIPLKTYITVILEGIGLLANIIAILSYFGAKNTPETSPNFYINNQEFFVWSLIAVVYTLGIILARMKRRWRRLYNQTTGRERDFLSMLFMHDDDNWEMFKRDFSFTLAISFPIIFLYVRAIQASATSGTASPWNSLSTTSLICIPISLMAMVVSTIFDNALALYAGD